MILAGDIGGTKTILSLFDETVGVKRPLRSGTFPSAKYGSLEAIITEFLREETTVPGAASFGVAGPVVAGQAHITNLPWVIDAASIARTFGIPKVNLLNDLEAIATAVPHLEGDDLSALNAGIPDPAGAIAVIAPGTGLGEAFLVWDGRRYLSYPTEGGHVSFAPGTQEELDLLLYLQPKFGHVSFERVCSGSGIPNIYEYYRDCGHFAEPEWLREELEQVADRTPVIVTHAQKGTAEICVATLQLFVKILGGEVGNMALKVLATGGIYIGGGIPPRILSWLQRPLFLEAVTNKGRFRKLLEKVPIYVIQDANAALHGAAYDGMEAFR